MPVHLRKYLSGLVVVCGLIATASLVTNLKAAMFTPPTLPRVLTNTPGDVKPDPSDAQKLIGSFTIEDPPNSAVPQALSAATGGACYIADLSFAKLPRKNGQYVGRCQTDNDCRPPNADALSGDALGYCAKQQPGTTVGGKCWVRPSPQAAYCVRSVDAQGNPTVWPVGQAVPLKPISRQVTINNTALDAAQIKWRVHSRLNCYIAPNYPPSSGCTTEEPFLTRDGKIYPHP